MYPLISIIIPTYNREDIIGQTLESIKNQTYINWECLIVDDGSLDETKRLIESFAKADSRFKYLERPKDKLKGPNSCRNFGYSYSKGELVHFFDSDDLYKRETLMSIVSVFKNDIDVIVCKSELIDFNSGEVLKENNIESETLIQDFFVEKINFYVCGPFWNKDFLKNQKELFDEAIGNGDDWDFNLRMLYKKPRLKFLNEALLQVRIHPNSFSREKRKFNKKELQSEFKVIERHYQIIKTNKEINKDTIQKYIVKRFNSYFMEALLKKNKISWILFLKVLKKEFEFNQYKQLIRTIFGFISYNLFKKGYSYLHIK
ncbi:glycosyltransferase family 2 protein [Seonamhaeicola sediminis]|uniref:Glycosyltransferase family 2 protein n=1 Tax=Seonamhaeicola sediminis TaxID=2528206 RepID=A0A562YH49_9FLAO|nr:glycosyltransferase family 2 protein [Seonamhaeicola sediminis]TWO34372.1 glycosyltransferase family 2 protein [Seonamhaeicola sediminis]